MKKVVEVAENQDIISKNIHKEYSLYSSFLKRLVKVELFVNEGDKNFGENGLLLLNDGQDLKNLGVNGILHKLSKSGLINPVTLVAITAGERKSEYGVAGQPDYLGRGEKAHLYRDFIIYELLPWVNSTLNTYFPPHLTAFAGCSLGGLSALDIVSSSPGHFGMAGVFSGSLWWRSRGYLEGYTDNDRIILKKLNNIKLQNHFRCWMMAGTNDEVNDRNRSGVIDAVEDTLDLFEILNKKMFDPLDNLHLRIVNGGHHNPATWATHFPDFLHTTFRKSKTKNS